MNKDLEDYNRELKNSSLIPIKNNNFEESLDYFIIQLKKFDLQIDRLKKTIKRHKTRISDLKRRIENKNQTRDYWIKKIVKFGNKEKKDENL